MIRARWFFHPHIHILANSEHSSAVGGGWDKYMCMLGGGGGIGTCVLGGGVG